MVVRDVYDQIAIYHPAYQKTISFITQNYYSPELKKIVQRYIQNYHSYRCTKAQKDQYNDLLKPLLIFSCP